jgi:methionyl-tRNA formyltransferase
LRDATQVVAVVTQPDRPAGRGQKLQAPPVKILASEFGIEVLQPESVREIAPQLRAVDVELFVVASYGEILSQAVLDIPRIGAFNVHPSLLPLYRGATPLQAQIRDRCTVTGVTIIAMDAGMDTGDVLIREQVPLGARETYGELETRLAELGAQALVNAIRLAERAELKPVAQATFAAQAEIDATLTRPLRSPDLRIDWSRRAIEVDALVRSLSPQPCARGEIEGVGAKIVATHPLETNATQAPGTPSKIPHGLAVACGEGAVAIDRIVPANRSVMSGEAFAASLFARS